MIDPKKPDRPTQLDDRDLDAAHGAGDMQSFFWDVALEKVQASNFHRKHLATIPPSEES